jgi:hypothetical protein
MATTIAHAGHNSERAGTAAAGSCRRLKESGVMARADAVVTHVREGLTRTDRTVFR